MKKLFPVCIVTLGLLFAVNTVSFLGCATKLDSSGVYAQTNGGGLFLFSIDKTLVDSKDTLSAFVTWEYQNRANVPPAVTKTADSIRSDAPLWFTNAYTLRAQYVSVMAINSPQTVTASNNLNAAASLISAQATAANALKK